MNLMKIILYALIVYVIYTVFKIFRIANKAKKSSAPPRIQPGVMVKDEICNTYLPKEEAIKEIHEGKEYYFCSEKCRQKFLEKSRSSTPSDS